MAAPRATPAPLHALGPKARARDHALVVSKIEDCKHERFFPVRAGHALVGVTLELEALGPGVVANGFYARLIDERGRSFSASLGGCEPVLGTRALAPGQKTSGVVSFELPDDSRELSLVYDPRIAGAPRQELRFRLQRLRSKAAVPKP